MILLNKKVTIVRKLTILANDRDARKDANKIGGIANMQHIDKLAWILIKDRQLLMTRSYGKINIICRAANVKPERAINRR